MDAPWLQKTLLTAKVLQEKAGLSNLMTFGESSAFVFFRGVINHLLVTVIGSLGSCYRTM